MVRIAGLRRQVAAGVMQTPPDGLTPQEQLEAIDAEVARLTALQRGCLADLLEQLQASNVRLLARERSDRRRSGARSTSYFESQIFPVLTPLAVDPGHPFPYISNLSLSLAVEVRDPRGGAMRFARVKVPKRLPRWVPVPGRPQPFRSARAGDRREPRRAVPGHGGRRLVRVPHHALLRPRHSGRGAGGPARDDRGAGVSAALRRGRFASRCRTTCRPHLRALLLDELREVDVPESGRLAEKDIQSAGWLLDLSDLTGLCALDLPALKDPPFAPMTPVELRDASRSIFDVIREGDLLVHHPFDSFSASVERFLEEAARDDQVLAIKLTLYRTSGDTAIAAALVEAAQRGKQVAVIVELKARFDETNNISWARQLEDAGVHVAFGSANLKTHAKTALVVRRETDGIRRYVHLGSGNYNSRTARLYTDVGLLTCSPSIGADVSDLFNSLTGYSRQQLYRKLVVAPVNMRSRFVELIAREAAHARAGRKARIVGKMNALVDAEIIDALYRASQAGVEIDLIVRGICCLRPGRRGAERADSRRQHHRPFPRALAALAFPQRRHRGILPRLRGLDAAQLRPARRGGRSGRGSGDAPAPPRACSSRISTTIDRRGTWDPTAPGFSASRAASRARRTSGWSRTRGAASGTRRAVWAAREAKRLRRAKTKASAG